MYFVLWSGKKSRAYWRVGAEPYLLYLINGVEVTRIGAILHSGYYDMYEPSVSTNQLLTRGTGTEATPVEVLHQRSYKIII